MAVDIKLQLNPLEKILAARHLDKTGCRKLASEVKRLCDPYVPIDNKVMKNTAQVMDDGVLYPQPYSAKQYYTNGGRSGGKRGKKWDERMMADHKGELLNTMANFTGGKSS